MTECNEAERLSAYHDGALSEPSRIALEEHLKGCPTCAAELARLARLSQLIQSTSRPEMPPQALGRFHRAIDLQPRITAMHVAEVFTAVAASILVFSSVCLWKMSTARADTAQIPVWETVAVAPQDPSGVAAQEQLARWIVQDLSGKNGHD